MKLNIVADQNMPNIEQLFAEFGTITRLDGRCLQQSQLVDTDLLLVRSVTKVNRQLLENTAVKFVGTATIGTDHVDIDYLKQNNIGFSAAPGCNANSVAEYILSALIAGDRFDALFHKKQRLAIVGLGNVGSRLAEFATILGFDFICYDPPKQFKQTQADTGSFQPIEYCSWEAVLNSDVISLHVPLIRDGLYPTYHMFGKVELMQLKAGSLLINSGRGAVIDNTALVEVLQQSQSSPSIDVILDVWENEPNINLQLRDLCLQHTPHIAGYSLDGKSNGSKMIHQAVSNFFATTTGHKASRPAIDLHPIQWSSQCSFLDNLKHCIGTAYDINTDSKSVAALNPANIAKSFDLLRQTYPDRLEFSHYSIEAIQPQFQSLMQALGFDIASLAADSSDDN